MTVEVEIVGVHADKQQQHYPHTNISSCSLRPRPLPPAPNYSKNGPPSKLWICPFHKLCSNCHGRQKCLSSVFLKRFCEHVVDVSVLQVVDHLFVVPKISSQTESCSVPWSRFLAVPVTLIVEQLVEVPKFVSQDRIQQRTLEQISDTPVPEVIEELVEVSTRFSQDRVQQRFAEQICETPAISSMRSSLIAPRTEFNSILRSTLSKLAPCHY